MISLRVKTLNGGDHPFTVDETISIEELKLIIASTVSIEPSHQRFIYMGRVLENQQILSSLELDGKTIHLVNHVPRAEAPEPAPPQPERPIRQRLSRMRVLNTQPRFGSPSNFVTNAHLAIEQSMSELGHSGYVHTRTLENARTLDIEVHIPPNNGIFELNYRVFLLKKFLECATRVLESIELNTEENFTDYDYFNEEQRIMMHRGDQPLQLSAQFQESPSMNFLVSISAGLSSTIRQTQTSFINEVYSSTTGLQLRFNAINEVFYNNLETDRPDSEVLRKYEARRNRFTHYIGHIYHGMSEITTVTESDAEYRLTTTSSIHEEEERRVWADRIRRNVSRMSRRSAGSSSFVFATPQDVPVSESASSSLNDTVTSQADDSSANVPRSQELRSTHLNVDALFSAMIAPIMVPPPSRNVSTSTEQSINMIFPRRRSSTQPRGRLIGEIPLDRQFLFPLTSQPEGNSDQTSDRPPRRIFVQANPLPETNLPSNPRMIHVRIDPFLNCHSYCSETENLTEEASTVPTEMNMAEVPTAPSTSSMLVQQDSESEFPRSTNFSDILNQDTNTGYSDGDQSDSHSQSIITVPDESTFLQQLLQNSERLSENLTDGGNNPENPAESAEEWMRNIPTNEQDWLRVIAEDENVQARTTYIQGPFSDAYINGMPAKRRRMIEEEKARNGVTTAGDLASIIGSASSNAMAEPTMPISNLSSLIENDECLMNSFNAHIHDKIKRRLDNSEDFDPELFPHTNSML